ncbi:MAG: lytic murein transglycosylase B [Methylobacter sp.]|nr:MAG: lytic murein transglycosylase B [Methylobacter sp.]PPD04048.1 MAG: lytic murein transglycosylase B [Methylobacter sp.]PPD23346.1 MAG: lytic murein transglycosylase B [Methylobacter sp.]PPD34887.1 MAG: lytic murein transglycosylase B [Methylomonas sp.]
MKNNPAILFCTLWTLFTVQPAYAESPAINGFIAQMTAKHQFDATELHTLFKQVTIQNEIIEKITSPAEALPWQKYRDLFLTEKRIENGIKFWNDNASTLNAVEQHYGVPAEVIVAIIGVETSYGQRKGGFRVIDALSTLAFAYPPRSAFFTGELEKFLLLCRNETMNPLEPTGSYAGAMGMPQFMPSSYLAYAVDFDNDKHRDIWQNPSDAIASVANYFVKQGWQSGQLIAARLQAKDDRYKKFLGKDLKPNLRLSTLQSNGINTKENLSLNGKIKLLAFEIDQGTELWAGLDNFYVITRYNHSPLYAMAVYQLSQAILNKRSSML